MSNITAGKQLDSSEYPTKPGNSHSTSYSLNKTVSLKEAKEELEKALKELYQTPTGETDEVELYLSVHVQRTDAGTGEDKVSQSLSFSISSQLG